MYDCLPAHSHFYFDEMADAASSARWQDIQGENRGIDSQMKLMVERSEAEGTRIPRPCAGDHSLTEFEFEGLFHTCESVRSDHAGIRSDIQDMSYAPAAPPNNNFVSVGDVSHDRAASKGCNEVGLAKMRFPASFGCAERCVKN